MAQLGRMIFLDTNLSESGRMSCATCHSPAHFYGPPGDAPVMEGGKGLDQPGVRAVPTLRYLERQPNFSVGPDSDEDEGVTLAQLVAASMGATRVVKTATDTGATVANMVPQGGLFWDGRADTLQQQALVPVLNPVEMDAGSVERVARKLRAAPYAGSFVQLFGQGVLDDAPMLVSEAMFAVARYQIEDVSFHPYSSKFDAWLEGKAQFTAAELRGYLLFNDPKGANCAGCHVDQPSADGLPPLFTDHQYEALGAPRNRALTVDADPKYFDLGVCGPVRTDMQSGTQYCGMFSTPTLRNVATRKVFFHNGVFHSLKQVLDFYNFRDVDPGRVYPAGRFDDLPQKYWGNVDQSDLPFGGKVGERPVMSERDEMDIIAFLGTLTDGYEGAGH
ncbi:MAG: cytochrome-c peroxidase [Acetobacteraceae bacterium]|nr:cytochrome-c peroxidase [Acetobacteraceae bacterium]